MPLYGNELGPDVTPYEAGLGRVVRLDKPGDFVGREALAARAADGPRRTLIGLLARSRRVPRHGYAVLSATAGTAVGVVTSGAPSPTLGVPIAMAYVETGSAGPFGIDVRGKTEPAEVTELPFYDRSKATMSVPAELRYTEEHEWVAIDGDTATIGITDYAAQSLGDVVYVSLPAVGAAVSAGEPCGEVESTKSVSDLYSPVDGEVTEVNEELDDDPGLVNAEPYGAGWMFRVRVTAATGGEAALPPGLLSATEYEELTKSAG